MTIKKRLDDLEQKVTAPEKPIAIHRGDDNDVFLPDTQERMTLEAFKLRYPQGVLIRVVRETKPTPAA